jgi:putative ABC transport system permease protein
MKLWLDLAYAWRTLRKSPGFAALGVLTLALGVGASIAVYALSEGLMLRSLPFPAPERLVALWDVHVRRGESTVGQENFRDWQAANTVFERMAYTEFSQVTLTGYGDAERITGRGVSEGFFEMLGVAPQLGRWFTPEEQRPGAAQVVTISHRFWARKLGMRPDVVGSTLAANGRLYRIVGVMPESFRFNEGALPDYWTPIAYRSHGRQQHQYSAYARLKPGVTVAAAQAQMTEIARRLEQAYPDNAGWGVRVGSLRSELLEGLAPGLGLFGAAALIVLLVACGNVASLLLARGIGRSREVAVRLALGAGRGAVARMLLAEGVLLSGLAALAGIGVAIWVLRLAVVEAPPWMELGAVVQVTLSLVAFAVGLTIATGVLTGLWPAVRGSRTDVQSEMKESGGGVSGGRRQTRSLHALVVGEIALAVVLLTFAGLLARSLAALAHTNLGYRTERVLTFRMPLPGSRYRTPESRVQFWDRLLRETGALPGVISAAASDSIPMGGTYSGLPVTVEGDTAHHEWADVMTREASVSPDYFRTLGIGLRAGRGFDAGDGRQAEPVAMVNETFARKLLPGREAVGTRVRLGGNDPWLRIVGVIADTRYTGPAGTPGPEVYLPYQQAPYLQFVTVHTAVAEKAVMDGVRRTVRGLDPELAITQVRTVKESVDLATRLERQMMTLVGGFAAVTLGMATLGLGGVMAYLVSRRRREIGLRMALGAARADIARSVVGQAGRLVAIGAALGVAGAMAGARLLESMLFGVKPRDPVVAVAAPLVLAVAALAACALPARRAAAVEPMTALREE